MFKIGSRVVCVDAAIKAEALLSVTKMYQQWVVKDEKYTIREFLYNDGIVEGVLLEELSNKPIYIDLIGRVQEPAFGLFRFREIEETSEEMEADEAVKELMEELSYLEI